MNLLFGKRWWSWQRLACLAATAAILFFIFRTIDFSTFAASLLHLHPGWFVVAFAVYGASLVFGALRWHMSLHATGRAIHPAASVRLFFIGHFFFVALFGAAGGDVAKSAVYARWYRFALPEVIAAAPLDRALGFLATIVLAAAMCGVGAMTGGLNELQQLNPGAPGVWFLVGISLAAIGGIALLFWKPRGESAWARTIRALRAGGWHFLRSPRNAAPGFLFALLAQFALSGVFALNLHAVSLAEIPWTKIGWTIPLITILSSMPFTVAGAGVREVAAITLLGLYGVPAADCVAASMLTLVCKLSWAGVGAGVLWREQTVQSNTANVSLPRNISVVVPARNEAAVLPETLRRAHAIPEVTEVIVVDGGSTDSTRETALAHGCRVLSAPRGRGGQMRAGAAAAQGDVVLLLHADTWLPANAGGALLNCLRDNSVVAGGFWKEFHDGPLLLLGSKWKCAVRWIAGRRIAGDQAMFVRRDALERAGGVPDMPLMEEFELCHRLRTLGRLALAEATVSTSARRFRELGVLRTYWRMWWITVRYRFGSPLDELRRAYDAPRGTDCKTHPGG